MNEVGFRFEQRHKWSLVAGSFVFGGLVLFCTFAAVVEDPRFTLASLFWLVPLAGCQIALREIKRGHLFFGPDHVTLLGWRDRFLPIHSVSLVKWRPTTRRVKLYSPQGKLTIKLDQFEFSDRVKIIHELRTRCAARNTWIGHDFAISTRSNWWTSGAGRRWSPGQIVNRPLANIS